MHIYSEAKLNYSLLVGIVTGCYMQDICVVNYPKEAFFPFEIGEMSCKCRVL